VGGGELDLAGVDDGEAGVGLNMMTDMMAARTRHFDEFFHDAARAGIRQGVILHRASTPAATACTGPTARRSSRSTNRR